MHAAVVPNDPLFARQWALQLINAPAAWDARALAGFPTGGGPVVGIVDSGVRTTHQDLQGAISGCLSASTTDAGSSVADGGCEDENGHGTNVTGTIVSRAGNGVGTAGLAFNSTAIVCKALDANNVGLMSDISACIVALRDRGARIINLSLVGPASETLYRAIEYAYGGGNGALVVAASGNDGTTNVNYPAGYAEAMSVAATDNTDCAPGLLDEQRRRRDLRAGRRDHRPVQHERLELRDLHRHVDGRAARVRPRRAARDRQPGAQRRRAALRDRRLRGRPRRARASTRSSAMAASTRRAPSPRRRVRRRARRGAGAGAAARRGAGAGSLRPGVVRSATSAFLV